MDLDAEFIALKSRVRGLEDLIFNHFHRGNPAAAKHAEARAHLEDGDLASAGRVLGLDKGKYEDDESHERRLRAEIFGAQAADAEAPRPKLRPSAAGEGLEGEKLGLIPGAADPAMPTETPPSNENGAAEAVSAQGNIEQPAPDLPAQQRGQAAPAAPGGEAKV